MVSPASLAFFALILVSVLLAIVVALRNEIRALRYEFRDARRDAREDLRDVQIILLRQAALTLRLNRGEPVDACELAALEEEVEALLDDQMAVEWIRVAEIAEDHARRDPSVPRRMLPWEPPPQSEHAMDLARLLLRSGVLPSSKDERAGEGSKGDLPEQERAGPSGGR
jgi:hypothetical protein